MNRSDYYYKLIEKYEPLSVDEEVELAKKAKEGDMQAREKLVLHNLKFVVTIAKQYMGSGLPLEDLIAEGNTGLLKAIDKFDVTRGFRFISYAVWWIRQAILQAISENFNIRIPANKLGNYSKYKNEYERLAQLNDGNVDIDEITKNLDLTTAEIREISEIEKGNTLSLDAPLGDSDLTLLDTLPSYDENPEKKIMRESFREELEALLNTLEAREKMVIKLYFGLDISRPLTLDEIAAMFKLTRERIRQLRERGLRKLRIRARKVKLREYLSYY